MNCWEFKKCGSEKGGVMKKELGVPPPGSRETLRPRRWHPMPGVEGSLVTR